MGVFESTARGGRVVLTALGILVAAVLGLKVLALAVESRLTFLPQPDLPFGPQDLGLPHEEVSFAAADGPALRAWFIPAESARPMTLVHFHGNAESRAAALPIALLAPRAVTDLPILSQRSRVMLSHHGRVMLSHPWSGQGEPPIAGLN